MRYNCKKKKVAINELLTPPELTPDLCPSV